MKLGYLINDWVIFLKSVFRFFYSYSLFLTIFFRVIDTWPSKFLTISFLYLCSVLSGFSLSSVFWSILRELVYIQHISNSTTDSSSRTVLCRTEIFYYDLTFMDIYGFLYRYLWISMGFISFTSQLERIIIDYLTKSAHFILFRMGYSFEVLAVFFYQQTSDQYYYGTVRGYIRQKCCLSLKFTVQSICENCPQLFIS